MATHDKYETDILRALQKIAGSLEKIEKKMPDQPDFPMEKHFLGLKKIRRKRIMNASMIEFDKDAVDIECDKCHKKLSFGKDKIHLSMGPYTLCDECYKAVKKFIEED